jgi:hypothetical protein
MGQVMDLSKQKDGAFKNSRSCPGRIPEIKEYIRYRRYNNSRNYITMGLGGRQPSQRIMVISKEWQSGKGGEWNEGLVQATNFFFPEAK